ncbi:hypothetical protein Ocin01_09007 [Orchesella cincta]|uniref:Uncharacterized protein n=1 Tax=Orchesella cincta TaxID=48709 RepID=A0A1D2MXK6_ORCCI|nr:hypothetical protein Ocin01_09007 [Orchesella cincta]
MEAISEWYREALIGLYLPISHVEGVLGHRVEMPCDIVPKRRDDSVYMVLWFRESAGKPLYR